MTRDLDTFHALLGNPAQFPFHLVELELKPTAAFERIKNLPKGSAETRKSVIDALRTERLFEFIAYRIE